MDFFKGKRVLVTGGAGFVGTNLIIRLLDSGAIVTATLHAKPAQYADPRITYITADLSKPEKCDLVCQNQDYVFMCAANTSGAAVIEKNPLTHVTPNVIMNALMLEAAYKAGVQKFLFISSNTVYPVTDFPVRESDMMTGPLFDKYFCVGWMKIFSETMCRMYAEKIKTPMQTLVIRPANIYGPYDDFEWETSHMIAALVRKTVERMAPFEVWGDGQDKKDYIYIDDFVTGIMSAMAALTAYEPVNIATGQAYTTREVVDALLLADGYTEAVVKFDPAKPSMIPLRLIDPGKAEALFGFKAKTTLAEGLKKTAAWYRTHQLVGSHLR